MSDSAKNLSISSALNSIIENYFNMHEGICPPPGLHDRVIYEVEKVLIAQTLKYTSNNQLKAASILGINRNTLRKKLQNHNCNEA